MSSGKFRSLVSGGSQGCTGGVIEKVLIGLLVLAAINLLIVLVTGGYRANLGLVRIAADNL
jgi:hypothetical protein